jgi:hypothetical protein
VHRPNRNQGHAWDWLTDGHVNHDGLCDVCGCAWPCQSISPAPYGPAEPASEVNGQVRAVARPVVYGYVRSAQRGRVRLSQWQAELHRFCQQAGLRLVHCFCSVGRHQTGNIRERDLSLVRPYVDEVYDTDPARRITMTTVQPVLRVLLAILEQRQVYGVVVPSIFHLATERHAALALTRHIERLGAKVMVVPASSTTNVAITDTGNRALFDALIEPDEPASNGRRNGGRA